MSEQSAKTASHILLEGVSMSYEDRDLFGGLACEFPPGRISVVLGGSGSGKTTLLRLIAGLQRPTGGRILLDGDDLCAMGPREMHRARRKLGMMFQHGALLDSLSVFDNLAFPLREHESLSESRIADTVHASLAAVGLSDVDRLLPGELSGGMTKRVALARALMRDPSLILVDEPFSGLDPISTKLIESLLVQVCRERSMTMVIVSHHIPSTLRMADCIVLLLPGTAIQGSPEDLVTNADPRVRAFLDEDIPAERHVVEHPETLVGETFDEVRRP